MEVNAAVDAGEKDLASGVGERDTAHAPRATVLREVWGEHQETLVL